MTRPLDTASRDDWRAYALWLEEKYNHVKNEHPLSADTLGPTGRKSRRW